MVHSTPQREKPRAPRAAAAALALALVAAGSALLVGSMLAWSGAARAIVQFTGHAPLSDFAIYHDQLQRLWQAPPSLHPKWYYPPFAASLLAPLSSLSREAASGVWLALQAGLLLALVAACASTLGAYPARVRAVAASGLVLASPPVLHGLGAGQLSLLVVVAALYGMSGGPRRAGLLALAACAKVYPVLYATGHLLRARARYLAVLSAWLLGLGIVVPAIVLPRDALAPLWGRTLQVVTRSSLPLSDDAQTLRAVLRRLLYERSVFDSAPRGLLVNAPELAVVGLSALLGVALVAFGLWRTRARAASDPVAIASLLLSLALVVEPGWLHYYVPLPYAQAVLLAHAARRAAAVTCGLSFCLASWSLIAALYDAAVYDVLLRFGLVPLAALVALLGLWTLPRLPAPRPARVDGLAEAP